MEITQHEVLQIRYKQKSQQVLEHYRWLFLSPNLKPKGSRLMNTNQAKFLCKQNNDQLQFLKSACRRVNEAKVLTIVWQNQGLLTHEIGDKFGCKSNNHHNVTRDLNPRLIKLGWVITKYHAGNPNGSWRWFVEPVIQALANPIRDSLRATIIENLEAANDE